MEQSLTDLFQKQTKQILDFIDTEVDTIVNLRVNAMAEILSKVYGLPVDSLIQHMTEIEVCFCKGIKGDKSRCLKKPKSNGYCGFHQKQIPPPAPIRHARVPLPWEET